MESEGDILKQDQSSGEFQLYLSQKGSWLTREGERAKRFNTKRMLPSVCFTLCLSASSYTSFDYNHFVKGKVIKIVSFLCIHSLCIWQTALVNASKLET